MSKTTPRNFTFRNIGGGSIPVHSRTYSITGR
jgi:hypothetical protein